VRLLQVPDQSRNRPEILLYKVAPVGLYPVVIDSGQKAALVLRDDLVLSLYAGMNIRGTRRRFNAGGKPRDIHRDSFTVKAKGSPRGGNDALRLHAGRLKDVAELYQCLPQAMLSVFNLKMRPKSLYN
jgi:hypothetical protein